MQYTQRPAPHGYEIERHFQRGACQGHNRFSQIANKILSFLNSRSSCHREYTVCALRRLFPNHYWIAQCDPQIDTVIQNWIK